MPVDHVVPEEAFDFLVDLSRSEATAVWDGSGWRAPEVHEFLVHPPRAEFADLSEAAKHREFVVGHTHLVFVGLYGAVFDGD